MPDTISVPGEDDLYSDVVEHTYEPPTPAPPQQWSLLGDIDISKVDPPEVGVPEEAPEYDEVIVGRLIFPERNLKLTIDLDGTVHRSTVE